MAWFTSNQTNTNSFQGTTLDLGVNNVDALVLLAKYTAFVVGRTTDAPALIDRAFKFNPHAPKWYYVHKQRIAYFCHDYRAVIDAAEESIDGIETDLFEILALGQLGKLSTLKLRVFEFNKHYPDFDSQALSAALPLIFEDQQALFQDGLAKAGLN